MILLDTHVWVWWVQEDERLESEAVALLDAMPNSSLAISAISFWEVALLARHNRLHLPDPADTWLANAASDPRVEIFPISAAVAAAAAMLPEIHKDPADRILIAQAIDGGYQLVSRDRRIHKYEGLNAVYPADLTLG